MLADITRDIVAPVVNFAGFEHVDPGHIVFDFDFVIERHTKFDIFAEDIFVGDQVETNGNARRPSTTNFVKLTRLDTRIFAIDHATISLAFVDRLFDTRTRVAKADV